jgi:acetyl-CoA carboxylase carboxyltransferase component
VGDVEQDFTETRERIRRDMGGAAKVAAVREAGRRTAREHLAALVDPGSFFEVGTFAAAEPRPGEDPWATAGDGLIGGHATIDGRPVTVCADDETVRRGTTGTAGQEKFERLYEMAARRRNPFVYFGQAAGARLPEQIQPRGFARNPMYPWLGRRAREVPVVTVIVGDSFGASSFVSGLSDGVVQLAGTCLALTSPRVVEVATGEQVTLDALGGPAVHGKLTGQIDAEAATPDDACAFVRAFLDLLPSHSGGALPTGDLTAPLADDPDIRGLVPARRQRAYDVRTVIARLVDDGHHVELKPAFAPNLVTTLGRIGGVPAGILASQPIRSAGAITPDSCLKAAKLVCLCDAFGLPLVFLQDTPGLLVGTDVEHDRAIGRGMLLLQALQQATVPVCTVVLRKAFGLAFMVMGGPRQGADLVAAWPGAEIGFMDPTVAANVMAGGRAEGLDTDARKAFLAEQAESFVTDFAPYGVASTMTIDEIIEPASTRRVLGEQLRVLHAARPRRETPSLLATWPTWF